MDPTAERDAVLALLESAVATIAANLNPALVPPEGLAFCYALKGARDSGAVAAVEGRIRAGPGKTILSGPGKFGSDEEISRIILSAMKFDPAIRSCALITHSPRAESVLCDDLFLESSSCEHQKERDSGPMDWGIASCCRDGVPDVIVVEDPQKRAVRILLFGEKPADVANNIIICSNRI